MLLVKPFYYGIPTESLAYLRTCAIGAYYDIPTSTCPSSSAKIANCAGCATGFFLAGGNCTACNLTKCGACSSITKCDQFMNGYYWNSSATPALCSACMNGCNTCAKLATCYSCPAGFVNIASTCIACPTGCTTCTGTSATAINCTSCATKYLLNNATASCGTCYETFTTCSASGTDTAHNCIQCIANATISFGNCNCNAGMTFSKTSGTCTCSTTSYLELTSSPESWL